MVITYRDIVHGEEKNVCDLIIECFDEFVAPDFSQEGINEFSKYVIPDSLRSRLENNHFILLALNGNYVVGIIEVGNNCHISLLFVRKTYQNQGIGKKLVELAIERCLESNSYVMLIDVHSSLDAAPMYEKLGFKKDSDEQTVNGIRFIPMTFKITNTNT